MWRPGLAALYAELDMLDEAAEVFDSLAADRFGAVPRDAIWPACLTFLAEVGTRSVALSSSRCCTRNC